MASSTYNAVPPLFVRELDGDYRAATPKEILAAASKAAGKLFGRGSVLQAPADSLDFLRAKLAGLEREVFACVYLDSRHRVLAFEILFEGTIDATAVYPREVVKAALKHNAAALILAHNHPSGEPNPSRADEQITARLKEALGLVDVRVLDHIIIGDGHCSLAERGLI